MPRESKYKKIDEDSYYETEKGRGVIRLTENKETKDKSLTFSQEAKNNKGKWVQRRGTFLAIPFGKRIINIFLRFMSKIGLDLSQEKEPPEEIKTLKEKLNEALKQKSELESFSVNLENEIKEHLKNIEKLRSEIVRDNLSLFVNDLKKFGEKLENANSEGELQEFLKERPWIFGPEYIHSKPKKPVGSKSIFDFYLEDYKGQGTVIELERADDLIFSKKESLGLSSKCGESLGQLIRYTEDTVSYSSNSRVSRKEKIDEDKPCGFLIIGRTKTKEEIDNLKRINSYLHMIQILSYDLLYLKANNIIKNFKILKKKNDN